MKDPEMNNVLRVAELKGQSLFTKPPTSRLPGLGLKLIKNLPALLVIFFIFPGILCATQVLVDYDYFGNFRALVTIPAGKTNLPVIIYNYDEYYDWAGPALAKRRGYDPYAFATEFERWGFICIIPLERYRKMGALQGAIQYAANMPEANAHEIHVVGISEGAFLSLLSLKGMPRVRSLTLLAPASINYTGFFSFPTVLYHMENFNVPVLFIIGANEKEWRLRLTKVLVRILGEKKKSVRLLQYECDKRWFWNPQNQFMQEIYTFVTHGQQLEKEPKNARTYTY